MTVPGTTTMLPTISRRSALGVTAATVVAAASGYLILVVAARAVGPAEYGRFSVFWALYFAVLGILFGIQQESTRATSAGTQATPGIKVRVVPISFGIGMAFAAILALTAPLWSPQIFPRDTTLLAATVVAASVLYAGQTGFLGCLSGARQWGAFARILTLEAVVRLVAVIAVASVGFGVGGLALATAVAAAAWLVAGAIDPSARPSWHARGDISPATFVRRAVTTMVAAAASAALVVGFPVLLQATTPGGLGPSGGVLVLAITLTRAPLLVPLNAFQGVAINHFVSHRSAGVRVLIRPALSLVALGSVGVAGAWLIGSQIMTAAFGPAYAIAPAILAALMVGATLIAALTLTGAAVIAFERHRSFAAGWTIASIISVAVLLTDLPLTERAILSLVIGPAVGIVVHLAALARDHAPEQ
ncbi:MAG: hypothetical protein ACOH2F_17470 [Cellulomonas sp.]